MNVNLINDIINDYTKLYDELYKKRYSTLNELLDNSKQDLSSLKEEITSLKETNLLNNESLSQKNKNFILCIKDILKNRLNYYIIDFLNILKKYIQYKLWTKNNSHDTIELMKEISDNPKIGIECQNKVVEVIHTLIFGSFFELNENDTINIYLINLKCFNNTNNYQNSIFKNPISFLFVALTDVVYKSNNNELITKITKFLFSLYIKDDDNNSDNEYLELLKDFRNSIYIKCLSLELLNQGLNIIKANNINNNFLDEIINKKIISIIKSNLNEIKKQAKNNEQQFIYMMKLCRLSMIIINYYRVEYDIVQLIIDFLKEDIKLEWQKIISMECLQEILNNSSLLIDIYNYNKDLIKNIFSILSSIFEQNKDKITQNNLNELRNKIKMKKNIEKSKIFLEGDEISILKEIESYDIINNIKECLNNIINSFSSMMKEYKLNINAINYNLSKEQEMIKQIALMSSQYIKQILFELIEKEYNSEKCSVLSSQKTISYIQNIIILYSSLNMFNIRDEYLKLICGLCLNFDNEKNIIICSSLLSLSKCTNFFNKDSFIIIFHTIEKIHIQYNLKKNEEKKDFDLIIKDIFASYQKYYTSNKDENLTNQKYTNEVEYKNEKIEKENLLCSTINTMFIDSKLLDISSLKYIISALYECLKIILNNIDKNDKEAEEIIIFYLTKILALSLLNIENIFILFDEYLIPIINLLIEKKILLNFTVNLICSIIKEILVNYKKIEANIKQKDSNSNKDNNWWLSDKWQRKVINLISYFTSEHSLIELTKNRLFICIKTIIQQSGNYIDLFGWETILKICQILINYNNEEVFLIIKLILNDYNSYLTIFNVMPIISLLYSFISYHKDRNICFNSIELFWSCTNIVEKYHKGKVILDISQQKSFESLLKELKYENFDIFYNFLYYKIFSQLLQINYDLRNDIRRSGIKVFTEIFVSKINSIEYENCFKIINEIFFKIFEINSGKYIEKEKDRIFKEEEINGNIIASSNKENELEQTLHASLLSMIKILKSFCSSNQNKEKLNDKNIENLFTSFLKKLGEIMPYGTTSLNTDILHGLSEIKNTQNNKKFILATKLDIFFEIMNKTNEFINSPRFKISQYNKMESRRFLNGILTTLTDLFCNELNYKIFSMQLSLIFSKIYDILQFLFKGNEIIEKKMMESTPERLCEIENNIFIFIENIPIVNEQYIYDFLIQYISYDLKEIHKGALCKRAIESFSNLLSKKNEKEIFFDIFQKLNLLFQEMSNDNLIEFFIKKNRDKTEVIFINFIYSIIKYFIALINKVEESNTEIINKLIEFPLGIYEKCLKEIKLIKDKTYIKELNDIYSKIINEIIEFLFIDLLPFIYAIKNEKEKEIELQKIENKLLKLIYFGCDVIKIDDKDNNNNNIDKSINETINHLFIKLLFKISKYQNEEEIFNYINKSKLMKNIDKNIYMSKLINFKKKCSSLMISKINNILKELKKEYEMKKEENNDLVPKIVSLLNEIKNLEVFPDLMNIEDKNEERDKYMNKKIHILYLYPSIIEYILVDNNEIKLLIKDLLIQVYKGIQLPPLPNILIEEEKYFNN